MEPRIKSYKLWLHVVGLPDSSVGKESACNAGDPCLIPALGRSAGEGIGYPLQYSWASLVAQLVKNPPAMWETWVRSLGWDDPLEKRKATHSSILAWRIPWTDIFRWSITGFFLSPHSQLYLLLQSESEFLTSMQYSLLSQGIWGVCHPNSHVKAWQKGRKDQDSMVCWRQRRSRGRWSQALVIITFDSIYAFVYY